MRVLPGRYAHCCRHHNLSVAQLFTLARRAIDFTFQSEFEKAELRAIFDTRALVVAAKYVRPGAAWKPGAGASGAPCVFVL